MGTITKDLGIATAYGYAVSKGYTGTEEEFATLMASYATVAEEAAESASEAAESASAAGTSATSAAESATSASASATSAGTSATTATTKASEASASAATASTAATTASAKAGEASQSATNAAVSATAAGNAQTAAETAQGKAEDAQAAAEAAQEAAEEAAATLVLDDTLIQPNQAAESKAVGDALVNKAPVIITSASGSIASFPDGGEDLPIENLVAEIVPKQDLHGYDNPWPEGATKNKFNVFALESVTGMTINSDGTITMSNAAVRSGKTLSQIAPYLVVGETYTFVVTTSGVSNKYIYLRDISMSWNYGTSKTITQEMLNSEVNFYGEEQGTATLSDIMIIPSTESTTPYIPYSNVCPISGWTGCEVVRTGKNLINYTIPNSHDLNISYSNGVYTAGDGDAASSLRLKLQQRNASYGNIAGAQIVTPVITSPTTIYITTIIREGAYTLRFSNNGASREFSKCFDISNLTPGMEVTFSVNLIDITIGAVKFKDCQLEFGSTASNYTPFQGSSTYPISWITTSGTVYGGRVNVTTGELAVDRATAKISDFSFSLNSGRFLGGIVPGAKRPATNFAVASGLLCDTYKSVSSSATESSAGDNGIAIAAAGNLSVRDERYATVSDFLTAMGNVEFVYTLATPLTYQLTPVQVRTLLGVNNVWADCGSCEVEYRADTKLYIERLTQPSEDDMVANANIESGKYFMIGNTLYLSTQAIAAGEAIIPGTNCTATNPAEALNTLNA